MGQLLKDAAENKPPRQMIGPLIHEATSTILFGNTGLGKSIFAVQIAEAIATGQPLKVAEGIELANECEAQKVMYFNFELSDQQYRSRYGLTEDEHQRIKSEQKAKLEQYSKLPLLASQNILDVQFKRGETLMGENPRKIFETLKETAQAHQSKVMIIDNVTALDHDLEEAKKAAPFMQELQRLARDENFTIIILMHTPKIGASKRITSNDIAGSKKLSTFADAIIGMNEQNGQQEGSVYLKQIKDRYSGNPYGRANVLCGQITRDNDGATRLLISHSEGEDEVLDPAGAEGSENKFEVEKQAALAYIQHKTVRKAAEAAGMSKNKINRAVKTIQTEDPELYKQLEEEAIEARNKMPDDKNLPF